jgi:1L-myo-inositol 1-phosphate cytidylyltransferase
MRAIITAAGRGSRLASSSDDTPKTLLRFGDGTILSRIMRNFAAAGISEFILVVGFQGEAIVEYLSTHANFGYAVTVVRNPDWQRGNGISVHLAGTVLDPSEDVLLSMSDHLVHPAALRAMIDAPPGRNQLLVDSRIDLVHDLEDATKVWVEAGRIVRIGKELSPFNAVDCGVFRLTRRYFDAMGRQIGRGRDSITEGVRELIAADDFAAVPIPSASHWIDIDTPAAYEHAKANRARYRLDGSK